MAAAAVAPTVDPVWTTLRSASLFASASDAVLHQLVAARLVHRCVLHRDTIVEVPAGISNALCFVISGQISIGVFDAAVLAERGRIQRDATLGERTAR